MPCPDRFRVQHPSELYILWLKRVRKDCSASFSGRTWGQDGNSRMARLVMDFILAREGYTLSVAAC